MCARWNSTSNSCRTRESGSRSNSVVAFRVLLLFLPINTHIEWKKKKEKTHSIRSFRTRDYLSLNAWQVPSGSPEKLALSFATASVILSDTTVTFPSLYFPFTICYIRSYTYSIAIVRYTTTTKESKKSATRKHGKRIFYRTNNVYEAHNFCFMYVCCAFMRHINSLCFCFRFRAKFPSHIEYMRTTLTLS